MTRDDDLQTLLLAVHALTRIAALDTHNDAPAAQWRTLTLLRDHGPQRLGDLATLSYTDGRPAEERSDVLRQAEALIGLRLSHEVPAGTLQSTPRLRFIQLLSAGLDSVDFDAIVQRAMPVA